MWLELLCVCVCVVYIFITIMKTNKQTNIIDNKKARRQIYINKIRENLVIIIINLKMHGIKVLTIIHTVSFSLSSSIAKKK
jgi:hypothetical protein